MRIIAGTARGRPLEAPPGRGTRPTADRVKEALFSIVEARRPIAGARVLDLYAGSGALALEALSRGAERATLVDRDRGCCGVIDRNARSLGFADRCEIIQLDAERALRRLQRDERRFDLVLSDPPYALEPWPDLARLVEGELLAADALVALEHSSRVDAPEARAGSKLLRSRRYGDTTVSIYYQIDSVSMETR